jgi:hypothetical protein
VTPADERERRLAENEALFRDVNESISATAANQGVDEHSYEFLCECSDAGCSQRILLSIREYERVRTSGERFALIGGHEDPQIERIVERHEGYFVVQKLEPGAEVARELDPRSGG